MDLTENTASNQIVERTVKVLFVEDDEDDIFLLQRACDKAGLKEPKEFLPNGQVAADYLTDHAEVPRKLRLIFLDLNMPLMGGLEFLNWLRQQPALAGIPVVVLTSSENPQDMRSAYELGANAYLVKPSSVAALTQLLATAQQFWLGYNRVPG